MAKPTIAAKKPMTLELEAGDYFWCACGKSADQPFCDGSHKGTEFKPQKFTLEEKKKVTLCLCKHTQDAPFCDGSHAKL
ncbi:MULTISPECIES: CDGSH iron-sulfur domain-containing protein [Cyanophyceae]|uniref:CDGSH iron-sulfur domain-containing protein n=1 Tax=Cyanophyceae TaxID=3028117 RepID=UPI000810E434|nr:MULTISPECIES: CDGSH iron-sulfur domain-containing protein [Cyanophyceae]ANV88430.1 cytochrome C551 [Picosynechococcus sp. PCC 7117]QCS48532.1 CDGSH iron-sulfur domain-containing protein [Picosynechococcus sp. PCC 11901]